MNAHIFVMRAKEGVGGGVKLDNVCVEKAQRFVRFEALSFSENASL